MTMQKYPKIKQFHQVIKLARKFPDRYAGEIEYVGTVKLHGTNAGVRISEGRLVPQSRNRVLTLEADNYGFAAFVAQNEDAIRRNMEIAGLDEGDTLFGEWIGSGIQSGVAIAQMPARQWVCFSVCSEGEFHPLSTSAALWVRDLLAGAKGIDVLPMRPIMLVPTYSLTVDLLSPASCSEAKDFINARTIEVEAKCPWGQALGIDGIGEGVVWKPTHRAPVDVDATDLYFKSKGGLHKGEAKAKESVSMSAEEHANVDAFVTKHVNSERVKQGVDFLRESGEPIEMRSTGKFLQWIQADIKSEASDELEASGLSWQKTSKALSSEAMRFWKAEVSKL